MVRTARSDFFLILFLVLITVPPSAGADTSTILSDTPADPDLQAPYTIQLFIPTQRMVHSDQINDLISGPEGETIIGTSFGLSTYNGSWSTRHQNLNNISEGLMDDYITAIEMDGDGNLWIGYSGGIQIYDGNTYRSIRDQQILKETRIKALQRWNNDMWVATGHAGIHRYRNGAWTWYQPMTRNGPGFYEVRSMGLDAVHNTLVIATEVEGLWTLQAPEDQPTFVEIASRYSAYGFLEQVKQDPDPRGGVYLFNKSMVVHYDPVKGFIPVLTGSDIAPGGVSINDITAAPDGRLFIATDNGMFIWKDGNVAAHLGRFEGMGTSPVVRTVSIDAKNRVWFSSKGYVGFYADQTASVIPIEMVTPVPTTSVTLSPKQTPVPTPVPVEPVITRAPSFFADDSFLVFLNPIIDPIAKALRAVSSPG
jgi:ligand-binding sensor domain-containing protein